MSWQAPAIVLLGDADQFPVRYIRAINTEWGTRWYPSDLYYADLYNDDGSFNDWDTTKTVLKQANDSVWTGNVMLVPGRYEYQLVVDGKWIADPRAQHSAASEFGAANSVIIVAPVPR